MNPNFKISLITGVLGSLIAAGILWILGYLRVLWEYFVQFFQYIIKVLFYSIHFQIWVIIIVLLVLIYFIIKYEKLKIQLTKFRINENKINIQDIILTLDGREKSILEVFFLHQGQGRTCHDFTYSINANELEIEQVLDNLIAKKIVRKVVNHYSGTHYYLTKSGRDITIELNRTNQF